jgi:hypothetical protein
VGEVVKPRLVELGPDVPPPRQAQIAGFVTLETRDMERAGI